MQREGRTHFFFQFKFELDKNEANYWRLDSGQNPINHRIHTNVDQFEGNINRFIDQINAVQQKVV